MVESRLLIARYFSNGMRRPLKNKRQIAPDFAHQSVKVAKLINYVMRRGKKETARRIIYGVFDDIKKAGQDPLEVFNDALRNVGPALEVKTRRVGGANYQIPHEVGPERRLILSLRWIVGVSRAKKGKPLRHCLAAELLAASKNEGEAVKKKEQIQRMAEANRAFAHFARRSAK